MTTTQPTLAILRGTERQIAYATQIRSWRLDDLDAIMHFATRQIARLDEEIRDGNRGPEYRSQLFRLQEELAEWREIERAVPIVRDAMTRLKSAVSFIENRNTYALPRLPRPIDFLVVGRRVVDEAEEEVEA